MPIWSYYGVKYGDGLRVILSYNNNLIFDFKK